MRVTYDADPVVDILVITTDEKHDASGELEKDFGVVVGCARGDRFIITSVMVIGGSDCLRMDTAKGYNAEVDTMTFGETLPGADLITENDDFVGYWSADEDDGELFPAGVQLRNASKHLAPVIAGLWVE